MAHHTSSSTLDSIASNGMQRKSPGKTKNQNDATNANLLLEAEELVARIQKHVGCRRDQVVRILREIFV